MEGKKEGKVHPFLSLIKYLKGREGRSLVVHLVVVYA